MEENRAWLEDLLKDTSLMGIDDDNTRKKNALNPFAKTFVPRKESSTSNLSLQTPSTPDEGHNSQLAYVLVDSLGNRDAHQVNSDVINNQPESRNDDIRDNHNADEETRNRLEAIIRDSEIQAQRARQAYINLYGPGITGNDNHDNQNGDRSRDYQPAVEARDNYSRDRVFTVNQDENRRECRNDRGGELNHGNRSNGNRGQSYGYNRQERDYDDEDSTIGPIRRRRGGRNQHERDAAYWRGKFFQLRNQSRKVKDFLFHDKY